MDELRLDYARCNGAGVYIYQVKMPESSENVYKIGCSGNIRRRVGEHSTSYPVGKIGVFRITKPEQNTQAYVTFAETVIHHIQKHFRVDKSREFFKIDNMKDFIKRVEGILNEIGCSVTYVGDENEIKSCIKNNPEHAQHIKDTLDYIKDNPEKYTNQSMANKSTDANDDTGSSFVKNAVLNDRNSQEELKQCFNTLRLWNRSGAESGVQYFNPESGDRDDAFNKYFVS